MDLVITGWRYDWPSAHSREWDNNAAVSKAFSASMRFGGEVTCEPLQPLSSCHGTLPWEVVLAFDLRHGIEQAYHRVPDGPILNNLSLGDHGNHDHVYIGGTELSVDYVERRGEGVEELIAFCRSHMFSGARLLLAGCEIAATNTLLQETLARAIGIEGLIVSGPTQMQKTGMVPASDDLAERRMAPYSPGVEGPVVDVQWWRDGSFSYVTRYQRTHTAFEQQVP